MKRVNWSGGGDIKPDSTAEWDIKTLTQAAMDFPDKVAACVFPKTLMMCHMER